MCTCCSLDVSGGVQSFLNHHGAGGPQIALFEGADARYNVAVLTAPSVEGSSHQPRVAERLTVATNPTSRPIVNPKRKNASEWSKPQTLQKPSAASGHVMSVTTVIFSSLTPCCIKSFTAQSWFCQPCFRSPTDRKEQRLPYVNDFVDLGD
jgi:hypothetical protein